MTCFWVAEHIGHDGFTVFDRRTDGELVTIGHDSLVGIVDEQEGGIVAYATPTNASLIVERLDKEG